MHSIAATYGVGAFLAPVFAEPFLKSVTNQAYLTVTIRFQTLIRRFSEKNFLSLNVNLQKKIWGGGQKREFILM
jgi:hypothetical protein